MDAHKMTADQLEALAAKKRREDRADVVDIATGRAPAMPTFDGTRTVDILGLEMEVDLDRINNWTLLKKAQEAESGDPFAIEELLTMALGEERFDLLMAHLASINERYHEPRVTDVRQAMAAIFGVLGNS